MQNDFKLPGFAHNQCCFSCQANKSTIPHNDYRPTAKWRGTLAKPGTPLPSPHPIGHIPGLAVFSLQYDTLHQLEGGVAAHAIANSFFDLVLRAGGLEAGTQEQNLQALYKLLKRQYLEQGIDSSNHIKKLSLTNFTSSKQKYEVFPDLTGYKAKQVRYLVPCLVEILKEFKADAYSTHRFLCMENLCKMYECMDSFGLHMAKAGIKKFQKACDLCLVHYAKCSKISIERGWVAWNTVHKHHLVAHMPSQAAFLNPKFVSTYSGETMVGHMASLAHACCNGTPPHLAPEKVLWRFRLGFHLKHVHGSELAVSSDED